MNQNETTIRDFIEAWSRLDPGELAGYFAEDGTYYNMPANPVTGRAEIEGFIRAFIAPWTETTWDLLNIVSSADVVIAERLDRTTLTNGSVELPCVGVFELEDGKIKVWRDYFDLATYQRALS